MLPVPKASPSEWRLQDAKSQFSELVNLALRGVPQHVTRRGKRAVVVLSEQDFATLQRNARAQAPSFVGHLLAIPKHNELQVRAEHADAALPSSTLALRDVDF
jgi:prevent-host-death family protein